MLPASNDFFYNIIKICVQKVNYTIFLYLKIHFSLQKIFKREIVFNIFIEDEIKEEIINYIC